MVLDEGVHHAERERPDVRDPAWAIRPVRSVTDVDDGLGRKLVEHGARHSESADPTVKYPDGRIHLRNVAATLR
jgi:hypothetical protein